MEGQGHVAISGHYGQRPHSRTVSAGGQFVFVAIVQSVNDCGHWLVMLSGPSPRVFYVYFGSPEMFKENIFFATKSVAKLRAYI